MKFIDFFAGVGGFRRGMELAGHECVGFCEFDKFATASYTSMHLLTQEQREFLDKMPLKQRQKEILKEEYRNGEWYANDIRRVYAGDIPKADCWCFGFPCQDISVAGKQLGFQGNRSSLFFRVMYLIGQLEEENRPTYLFIENVKNLLSVNGGWDFARLLIEMERGGYDAEWQVLNSKDFGVPQNRERCFIIGHLRGRGSAEVFPVERADREDSIQIIGHRDGYRRNTQVFAQDGITEALSTCQGGGREHHVAFTYSAEYTPASMKVAKSHMQNYIRRLNYQRKKRGLPNARYVYVTEQGDKGRWHHHIVLDGDMDMDTVESLWTYGKRNQVRRLQKDENGLVGMAKYVSKPKGKGKDSEEGKYQKIWTPSKNLKKPDEHKNHYKTKQSHVDKMVNGILPVQEHLNKWYASEGYEYTESVIKYNKWNGQYYIYARMRKQQEEKGGKKSEKTKKSKAKKGGQNRKSTRKRD